MEPSSQTPSPTTEPDKNGRDTAVNALRRELLNDRAESLNRWLTTITIGLAVFSIVFLFLGYLGFQTLQDITEAKAFVQKTKTDVVKYAEEVETLAQEARKASRNARTRLAEINAESVGNNPTKAARTATRVQGDPEASLIDRARAEAVLLQADAAVFHEQGKIEEAIEKWRSIINIAGAEDNQLQARAWASIGYLHGIGVGADLKDDLKKAIDAYTEAIALDPDDAAAYYNRGEAKRASDHINEAREDYQKALDLAQEAGDANIATMAEQALNLLDNDEET